MSDLYYYFVEGECEKQFVKSLIHSSEKGFYLVPGRVEIFNIVAERLTCLRIQAIKRGSKVVFIYDTDVKKIGIFEENIDALLKYSDITLKDIIFVPSVKNLEEEIEYCCNIKAIGELLNTNGKAEFKKKFINHKDIVGKLVSVGFDFDKLWSRTPNGPFEIYKNNSKLIKKSG